MSVLNASVARACAILITTSIASPLLAQSDSEDASIETIQVTGSRIFGQGESASPLVQVSNEDLLDNPAITISEFLRENVPANTMIDLETDESETSGQQNTANRSAGVNLWNLGEENSLTLINGARVVSFAAPNNGGWYNTDVNSLFPSIAMGRADILLDGGGAIYGTDAVAGVVNMIPRYGFEGLELQLQTDFYPDSLSDTGANSIQILWGTELADGRGSLIAAADFRTTSRLEAGPLGWETIDVAEDVGQYAAADYDELFLTSGAYDYSFGRGRPTLPDALCGTDLPGIPYYLEGEIAPAGSSVAGTCLGYGSPETTGRDTTRNTVFAALSYDITDSVTGTLDIAYATTELNALEEFEQFNGRNTTSSFTRTMPNDHPALLYYQSIDADWAGQAGRTLSVGGQVPANFIGEDQTTSDTINIQGNLDIEISNSLGLSLAMNYGKSEVDQNRYDFIADRYQDALNGLGGPNCDVATGTPGTGDCYYYNPFLSSLLADADTVFAGGSLANGPGVVDHFFQSDAIGRFFEFEQRDFVATFDWATGLEMPGGEVLAVVGTEYREEEASGDYNAFTQQDGALGQVPAGQVPYSGTVDVTSAFFETVLPISDSFKLQLAGRWDDYSTTGSTTNPKLGFTWDLSDHLTFRGSYGTSYKAPSVIQGLTTATTNTVPSVPGGPRRGGFRTPVVNAPAAALAPQEAEHYSLGVDFRLLDQHGPLNSLSVSASFVDIAFTNRIDVLGALSKSQGVDGNNVCAFGVPDGSGGFDWGGFYTTEDLDLDGTPDGGAACWEGSDPNGDGIIDTPGELTLGYNFYSNLLATDMQGMNYVISTSWDTPMGDLNASLNASQTLTYDTQGVPGQPLQDFVGFSGLGFGTDPNVREWKGNLPISLSWADGALEGQRTSLTARFDTDIKDPGTNAIDSGGITTWDLRHSINIMDSYDVSFTVRNLTGAEREDPNPLLGNGERTFLLQIGYRPR